MDTEHFKTLLLAKKVELQRSLANTSGDIHIEHVPDELDNVVSKNERELSLAGRDRSATTLRLVLSALQRVQDGTYGECVFCEREIPLKRLLALPWAQRCVACQTQHDNTEKEQMSWGLEDL